MRFRKLRIAWWAFWGLAAVLLIVLWVRSHFECDYVAGRFTKTQSFGMASRLGKLSFVVSPRILPGWWADTISLDLTVQRDFKTVLGFDVFNANGEFAVRVPYAFLASFFAAFAAVPWIRWRFSLRTLLIATTLVALVLGLIVAVLRWPAG